MDVVTNDLVKDNKGCLDDVTDALEWIHHAAEAKFPAKSSGDMGHPDLWSNRLFKYRSFSLVPSP